MFAIMQKDLESIGLLRNAGACPMRRNNDGCSSKDLAEQTEDKAVKRALCLDKEQSDLLRLAKLVCKLFVFMITWVNQVTGAICRMFELDTELSQLTKELVPSIICEPSKCPNQLNKKPTYDPPNYDMCTEECSSPDDVSDENRRKAELVTEVDNIYRKITPDPFLSKKNDNKEVAHKAADLEKDQSTSLGNKETLSKTIMVSLHRQVIYCDDSSTMRQKAYGDSGKSLWDCQKELVERITQITTRILPEGQGIVLQFINQKVDNCWNLTPKEIKQTLERIPCMTNGSHTKIGLSLKSKILQPLVYNMLKSKSLDRPLLISVITDGIPNKENRSQLAKEILECGNELQAAGYPRESVKFMVAQIGESEEATEFLNTIRNDTAIASVVYCASDRLDKKSAEFQQNNNDLDQWLIETLFGPMKDRQEYDG
ncbi:hypothetical protein BFW01_g7579 [Lasiodiplodia theobromae]|nr:hypothetical protein BFW01_g7579 [Lasiodiplodia theobromae]